MTVGAVLLELKDISVVFDRAFIFLVSVKESFLHVTDLVQGGICNPIELIETDPLTSSSPSLVNLGHDLNSQLVGAVDDTNLLSTDLG